jgi:hypothetical protein
MVKSNKARIKVTEKAALARKHQPAFSRFFRKQGLMVLDRLETIQHQFTHKVAPLPSGLYDSWNQMWGAISLDTFAELQVIITEAESDGMLKGAAFGVKQFGTITPTSKTFSLENPRAVAWFKRYGGTVDKIKGIQDTTSAAIKDIIARGLDEGQSYNQIAKGIRSEFDGMTRDRAQVIATYETGNAYEAGNMAFSQSLVDDGVTMEKAWNCEAESCDICKANEAEGWIPIDQLHRSGDQQPEAHPRCICYETYQQAQGNA